MTRLLPEYFSKVVATDVSDAQVTQARSLLSHHDNIHIRLGSGEQIFESDASVHLVTICQALHWLDVTRFYQEVDRVLVEDGVLAVLGYHFTSPSPDQPKHDEVGKLIISSICHCLRLD